MVEKHLTIRNAQDKEQSIIRDLTVTAYAEYQAVMPPRFWTLYQHNLIVTLDGEENFEAGETILVIQAKRRNFMGIVAQNGSVLYLGVAVGSALGGLVLAHASVSALGIAGGMVALLALGVQLLSTTRVFTPVSPREKPEQEAPMRSKEPDMLEPLH